MPKRKKPAAVGQRVHHVTQDAMQMAEAPLVQKPSLKQRCEELLKAQVLDRQTIVFLRNELEKQKRQMLDNLEHNRARTELIKALGIAMKTCSSALWSDRKSPWEGSK